MARVLPLAKEKGIGIFAMKALAGGHLYGSASEALSFVLEKPFIDACAVGMQSRAEVDANIEFFSTGKFSSEAVRALGEKKRVLHIEDYCEGCGACVARCPQGALRLEDITVRVEKNPYDFSLDFAETVDEPTEKTVRYAAVDHEKCVLCAYCTAVCPVFALKVF
jgi:ferredoxin